LEFLVFSGIFGIDVEFFKIGTSFEFGTFGIRVEFFELNGIFGI